MLRVCNLFGATFGGIEMRQLWSDLALWEIFLNDYEDIRAIVELGTGHGGMSAFLRTQGLLRDISFITFDREYPDEVMETYFGQMFLLSSFLLGDFWEDGMHQVIVDQLEAPFHKPVLLFVDGGCKKREFAEFVPKLSSGDYVAVHDYGTEFQPEDIRPVEDLIEPIFVEECESPPKPCLTRFWRVR